MENIEYRNRKIETSKMEHKTWKIGKLEKCKIDKQNKSKTRKI